MKRIVTENQTLITDQYEAAINYVLSTYEYSGAESVLCSMGKILKQIGTVLGFRHQNTVKWCQCQNVLAYYSEVTLPYRQ